MLSIQPANTMIFALLSVCCAYRLCLSTPQITKYHTKILTIINHVEYCGIQCVLQFKVCIPIDKKKNHKKILNSNTSFFSITFFL